MSSALQNRFSRLGSLPSFRSLIQAGGGTPAPDPVKPRLRRLASLDGIFDRTDFQPLLGHARFRSIADLNAMARGQRPTLGPEAIKAVQQAFLDLGFAVEGGADGLDGRATKQATRNFQASQGLPLTGQLDARTILALSEVAPAPGMKAWEDPNLSPKAFMPPERVGSRTTSVVIGVAQHRAFVFNPAGQLQRIYPIASGAAGSGTDAGLKVVTGRNSDPSEIARRLWPESQGRAFGTRLFDLSWYDPKTGKTSPSGEELHGTFDRGSIGFEASHGCMRMYNEDVEALFGGLRVGDLVQVNP